MQINKQTVSNEPNFRQNEAPNILKHAPGPRGAVKRVQTPLDAFKSFFTCKVGVMIVKNTNNSMRPVLKRFTSVVEVLRFSLQS